jgi:anti-anti-sigma factor
MEMEPVVVRVVRNPSTRPKVGIALVRRRSDRREVCTASEARRTIERLLREGRTNIAVEVKDGSTVDSTLLWILLRAERSLRAIGGQLSVVTSNRTVREILRVTLIDTIVPVFSDRSAAFERLEAA